MADAKSGPLRAQFGGPLSHKLEDTGAQQEPPSSSAPVQKDYRIGRRAPRGCGCLLEVTPRAAKWLYFGGFTLSSIVSWIFRWACAVPTQHQCR